MLGASASAVTLGLAWDGIGTAPRGERRVKMEASAQWAGGGFENPQPLWNDTMRMVTELVSASPHGSPSDPLPVERIEPERFATAPETGLRATWLGHSSVLIEIDGFRVLTDPVWGPRTSPLDWLGPERWYAPLIALDALPPIDAVVISHDHYDHLDHTTIREMADWDTRFLCPLGVGAHLAYWGIPESRIVELDWWEDTQLEREGARLDLALTPARHASGRQVFDQNRTLWGGYALIGSEHRVYFSGDTGLFPDMTEIGVRYGPFDLAMIETGAYGQAWPDWHIGPEQALRAHTMVRGELFMPIHWGLFNLAYHSWTEPIERVVVEAERRGAAFVAPRPGQSVEPERPPAFERWWPQVPWRKASEYPIVSTKVPPEG